MMYCIADISVDVQGEIPGYVLKRMKNYEVSICDKMLCISCKVCDNIAAKPLDKVYDIKNGLEQYGMYNNMFISQDAVRDVSYATIRYNNNFTNADCVLTDVEKLGGQMIDHRMFISIGSAFLNCLPTFGAVTLHSSAISYKNKALLFAAPSGTGKSTHTRLWKKYYSDEVKYINDDTPVVRKHEGKFFAYGTPWAGTSGINNNIKAPLCAVIYIKRAAENSIRRLSEQESISRLMKSARMQFFPAQREKQTKILFEIMRTVPVYELKCDISRKAVETVKQIFY